jgi:hypothetical protein
MPIGSCPRRDQIEEKATPPAATQTAKAIKADIAEEYATYGIK